MIKPTSELFNEAVEDLGEVLDYIASEYGTETSVFIWLSAVEAKLKTIRSREIAKVEQQKEN
jgi:hypothetical protein